MIEDAMANIGNTMFRNILNKQFEKPEMSPGYLVAAISNNVSLWEVGHAEIESQFSIVPGFMRRMAKSYILDVEKKYGSVTELAKEWLKVDHPTHYSLILNTPDGEEWLNEQVYDILYGLNLKDIPR